MTGTVVAIEGRAERRRRLDELAEELEGLRWAFEIIDPSWRLYYVSKELRSLLVHKTIGELPVGDHFIASRYDPSYRMVNEASRRRWLEKNGPYIVNDDPGVVDRLRGVLPAEHHAVLAACEPRVAPPRWASSVEFDGREFTGSLNYVGERVHDENGQLLGYLLLYGPSLPASTLGLLTRGDASMFERMAQLAEPGRRQAAVLFAALDDSTALSRRLPSAVYFDLVRQLVTRMDEIVVQRQGLIGKHTGDGVTGFFLADDHGSGSSAARVAIEAAREIAAIADRIGSQTAAGRLLGPGEWRINIGIHWGSTLYIGQMATGGRLEVAALGDEFNEALRIQMTADNGAALASKALIERLDDEDATALGLEPERMTYTTVAELPTAGPKAIRDAGTVAVTDVSRRPDAG